MLTTFGQMPWYMQVYVLGFAAMLILNCYYSARLKCKTWLLTYEILSGAYMLFLLFAYWNPELRERLSVYCALPFLLVLAVDVYLSTWGDLRKLGVDIPETSDKEMEIVKAFSVLLASPAYIVGALLSYELIQARFNL